MCGLVMRKCANTYLLFLDVSKSYIVFHYCCVWAVTISVSSSRWRPLWSGTLLCESRDIVIVRDYHVSVSDNERMSSQTSKWLPSETLTRLIHKSATSVVSYLIYNVNLIKHRQTLIILLIKRTLPALYSIFTTT